MDVTAFRRAIKRVTGKLSKSRTRNDPDIKGIKLPNEQEQKIKQYADDTACPISTPKSYNKILMIAFDEASGARINRRKTEREKLWHFIVALKNWR